MNESWMNTTCTSSTHYIRARKIMRVRSSQCAKKAFPLSVEVHDEKGKRTTDSFFAKKKKLPCQLFYGGCSAKNDTFTNSSKSTAINCSNLEAVEGQTIIYDRTITLLYCCSLIIYLNQELKIQLFKLLTQNPFRYY